MKKIKQSAVFVLLGVLLLLTGCPDPVGDDAPAGALDSRLTGVWRFEYGSMYEQITITTQVNKPGYFGTFEIGGTFTSPTNEYKESFAGHIAWAEPFSNAEGILIIEYFPGRENRWPYWGGDPAPPGNFYGVYYLDMHEVGGVLQAKIFCTNDQERNYGPTETADLEEAKAKFIQDNISKYLNLSVGDPQKKQ